AGWHSSMAWSRVVPELPHPTTMGNGTGAGSAGTGAAELLRGRDLVGPVQIADVPLQPSALDGLRNAVYEHRARGPDRTHQATQYGERGVQSHGPPQSLAGQAPVSHPPRQLADPG